MKDFQPVPGFHDLWRAPGGPRARPEEGLAGLAARVAARDRLARLTRRAPQVVTTVKGALKSPAGLKRHLDYISRDGALDLEERTGTRVKGREAVRELAEDWAWTGRADSRDHNADLPIALCVVLSMPHGVHPSHVLDASRDFARTAFGETFDYALVLHRDAQPHVHLCVRSLGEDGRRLRRTKADLEVWRQTFAAALRARGVEADATPRRARGVVHKADSSRAHWVRVRYEAGEGEMGVGLRQLLLDAAKDAVDPPAAPRPWEEAIQKRQAQVRGLYLTQAEVLKRSPAPEDRALGEAVEAFVRDMPPIETQRQQIARLVRAENARTQAQPSREPERER